MTTTMAPVFIALLFAVPLLIILAVGIYKGK